VRVIVCEFYVYILGYFAELKWL